MQYKIKENSPFAKIPAWYLRSSRAAMVIGSTIHLTGVSKEEFLQNKKWLAHELCHVAQYNRYGTFKFLYLYLEEFFKHGYYNNKFEKEAWEAGRSGRYLS